MDILYKILSKKENPETIAVSGFLKFLMRNRLSLGELRSATGCLQTVLLRTEKRKVLETQGLFELPFKFNP